MLVHSIRPPVSTSTYKQTHTKRKFLITPNVYFLININQFICYNKLFYGLVCLLDNNPNGLKPF